MIKAIFFDIDDTLMSHRLRDVPPSARDAFARLKEKGILRFAATGRHILELDELPVRDLTFDGYVTLNGQLCFDAQRTLLYDCPMAPEDAETLLEVFRHKETPLTLLESDRIYINFLTPAVRTAQQAISSPVPPVGVYTGNRIYQGIAYGREEEVQAMMERVPGCVMTAWNRYGFDIIPRTGGKMVGIQHILEHFGITPEEIMAFGDGANDTDMLRYAGTGVAMGNACEEVRCQADYVTSGVDEDGIAQALAHFGLL